MIALSRLDCAQVAEERLRDIVRELDPEADLDEYNVRPPPEPLHAAAEGRRNVRRIFVDPCTR